jgi:NAD(P)-dependent dehydrogenase (short-subunit alcohol dehydrogenase family)
MNMTGRICLITGATSGIGKAAAIELAKMNATVVMVARNKEKGEQTLVNVKQTSGNSNVDLLIADLSSMNQVRNLAEEFKQRYAKLHVLINNAGLANLRRYVTEDGYETTFATNYLAAFLLTNLLLDTLKTSAPSRIVNVSSVAHYNAHIDFDDIQLEKNYGTMRAYGISKLALVLFTRELARRLNGTGVTSYSLHPGAVATNIWTRPGGFARVVMTIPKLFMISPKKGAETVVYLASSPDVLGLSGEYFEKKQAKRSSEESYDESVAKKLWEVSAELTHLQQVKTSAS